MRPSLSGLDGAEHNPPDEMLPLLAERAFREASFNGDLGGGHQLVYRAAIGHTVQLVALFVGEYALERQLDVELVFALLLFGGVVGDFHGDTGQRDVFFLGIELDGQRLA